MNYESLRRTWVKAFRESGLRLDEEGDERLNLHSMTRNRSIVEFSSPDDDDRRYQIGASLSWSWDALQTARTTIEEVEMLAGLLGPDTRIEADPPLLRVEVELHAIVMDLGSMPLPIKPIWAKWVREAMGRLEHVEPLVPPPTIRETESGALRCDGSRFRASPASP